jgi:hypothetical protein
MFQLVGLLKKMGSIISKSSNKSYYEDWTENNSTYCEKFPGNLKASYNCGKKSKHGKKEDKAYTREQMES